MKKTIALLTAVIMMTVAFSGCMSDDMQTEILKGQQFTDGQIGEVELVPNSVEGTSFPCGINSLRFQFQRVAIKPHNAGYITVYNAQDDSVVHRIDALDASRTNMMADPNNRGAVVEYALDKPLEPGGEYYVTVDEGIFAVTGKEEIVSPAYGGRGVWDIAITNYGIMKTEGSLRTVDDVRTFYIEIGEPAVSVKAEMEGDAILLLDKTELTESGTISATVMGNGYAIIAFLFCDENGKEIERLETAAFALEDGKDSAQ